MITRHVVTVTVDASGDGTGRTTDAVFGRIAAIRYVKTDYDNTADFTITGNTSGIAILTASNITASTDFYPTAAVVDTANAARLYAAGGTAVSAGIPVANEQVKIVVAQGGNAKTGTFHVFIES